jgi:4-hydroxybenzoyl-CoA thioesterase/acyl-CoA thioester hydrolase
MAAIIHATRRVEFADTDAAGIMHFSAYFRLMEQAEHEWWRNLGLSVLMRDAEGPISWPRVRATCEFRSAAKFEDVLDIQVSLLRLGETSITFGFLCRRGEHDIATGEITAVCCRLPADGQPQSISIPSWIRDRLVAVV